MTETLVTLTGSDKQIDWAEDIRREALESLVTYRAQTDAATSIPAIVKKIQLRSIDGATEWLSGQTDAGWFINVVRRAAGDGKELVSLFIKK